MGFFFLKHGCLFLGLSHRTKKFCERPIKRKKTNREKRSHKEKNAPFFHVIRLSGTPYTTSDLTIQKKLSVKDTKKITGNNKKVINLRRRCEDKASTHYLI